MPPVTGLPAVRGKPTTAAGPGLHARACAAAALGSVGLHLLMAGQHAGWAAVPMLVMALLCLPCVLPLWRDGSVGAARMMMGSALAMVAVHAVLLLYPSGGSVGMAGHRHGSMPIDVSAGAAASTFSMLALIGWELMAAMAAATWLRRHSFPAVPRGEVAA